MYIQKPTRKFKKDYKRVKKQGKDLQLLKNILNDLGNGIPLDPKYKDHDLYGNYEGCRECHLYPDWLLIYEIKKSQNALILVRTGSHSDLLESMAVIIQQLKNILQD